MLAPAIVLFAAFMAAPILYTVMLSFQKKQAVGLGLGSGGRKQVFAGIENYLGSLSDPEFGASVGRVLLAVSGVNVGRPTPRWAKLLVPADGPRRE